MMKYFWDNGDLCVCKTDGCCWWVYDNDDHCWYEESPEAMKLLLFDLTPITEADAMLKLL